MLLLDNFRGALQTDHVFVVSSQLDIVMFVVLDHLDALAQHTHLEVMRIRGEVIQVLLSADIIRIETGTLAEQGVLLTYFRLLELRFHRGASKCILSSKCTNFHAFCRIKIFVFSFLF